MIKMSSQKSQYISVVKRERKISFCNLTAAPLPSLSLLAHIYIHIIIIIFCLISEFSATFCDAHREVFAGC